MSEPLVMNGKVLASKIEETLKERVGKIISSSCRTPILATILVGDNPASVTYVNMKGKACRRIGLEPRLVSLPQETTTDELLTVIDGLNRDEDVCGILLQHPVPKGIDEARCFNAISVDKDVDGVNVASFGAMTMGQEAFLSATPGGIIRLLKEYGIQIEGKEAVVIGRSPILGKPVSMLLLRENATVTVTHRKTVDLPSIVRRADIVVACVGVPEFVKADWIKPGAVLVDAGYNPGNIGDIDQKNCIPLSSAYTPVPGGVGPMTICTLMEQTVIAAERKFLR